MRKSIWITASIAVVVLFLGSIYFVVANGNTAAFKITVNYADGSQTVSDPRRLLFESPWGSIVKDSKTVTSVKIELQMFANWGGSSQYSDVSGSVSYNLNGNKVHSSTISFEGLAPGEVSTVYVETLTAAIIEGWDSSPGEKTLELSGDVVLSVTLTDGTDDTESATVPATWTYIVDEESIVDDPEDTTLDPDQDPSEEEPPNQYPIAEVNGPYAGAKGSSIKFSSSGSRDPDGSIAKYRWTFGDGGTSTSANPSHTYSSAKLYTVKLTVTDNNGATDSETTQAYVTVPSAEEPLSNSQPIAECGSGYSAKPGISIHFSSAGSQDSDGSIVKYRWTFGDGGSSSSSSPYHAYANPGIYTVKLTVTDDDGATDSDTASALITTTNTGGYVPLRIFRVSRVTTKLCTLSP